MKKFYLILFICISFNLTAQRNARYGREFAPYGLFRVLTVFADVTDDTVDYSFSWWNEDELPDIADQIFEYQLNGRVTNYVTKYFYEASFGNFIVLGDYYPHLVKLQHNDFTSSTIMVPVINYLNSTPANDTLTQHGYGFSSFDRYGFLSNMEYRLTIQSPDNKIDMLNVIWRRNKIRFKTAWGGFSVCRFLADTNQIKNFSGVNGFSHICHESPHKVFCHEFSHTLIGDNNYHTGGAGTGDPGTFLSNVGGYSMLSSYNANLDSYNGWDRWWLGWKHPSKQHYISAVDSNGNEIEADLIYGEPLANNEFILRNFADYGDAVRIKLPYLKTLDNRVRNQYLWIENHQIRTNTIEYEPGKARDIRFNIQIGNDNLTANFLLSRTNYYVPLSAFGNYDFDYTPFDTAVANLYWYDAFTSSNRSNPFCGYHPSMLPAIDANLQYSSVDDKIQSNEFVMVHRIYKDGESVCGHLPVFGNSYDAFHSGTALRLASNPPSTPLLTYKTYTRQFNNEQKDNPSTSADDDNRHIWLNGLKVDIVEKYSNGNIKVRIVWDNYDVDSDVRWCGPIMLTETLILKSGKTILLDYGQMPTRPVNPMTFDEKKIFADPTVFTCRTGSLFQQERSSKVLVKNLSSLVLEPGSEYVIDDGALLDINSSATLVIKSGAMLRVRGSGRVEIRSGAYVCIEQGADIVLESTLSVINLHNEYAQGVNPLCVSLSADCTNIPLSEYPHGGQGRINVFSGDTFIQNRAYSGDSYETGTTIKAGHHVTDQTTYGNVTIENGATVVFDAEEEVRLEPGVEVKTGGALTVR